ncbi:hypothetical protein OKW33_004904 [Paraburkholderia atlantica]
MCVADGRIPMGAASMRVADGRIPMGAAYVLLVQNVAKIGNRFRGALPVGPRCPLHGVRAAARTDRRAARIQQVLRRNATRLAIYEIVSPTRDSADHGHRSSIRIIAPHAATGIRFDLTKSRTIETRHLALIEREGAENRHFSSLPQHWCPRTSIKSLLSAPRSHLNQRCRAIFMITDSLNRE